MEELCIENLSISNATLFANASMIAESDKLKNICLEFLSKCMETHTSVKNVDILDAEIEEILFRESFETILE
uniref:Uncharacterized protein n=1 Tax=Panagrolaimus superbus TaxID=310955 RepID=A0A914Z8W0_9BILA